MRLLIHGGYFKTGTTAFQQWLHASRDRLSGMGIFVPVPGPHDNHGYPLNRAIRSGDTNAEIWRELDAAADRGHDFAILSAETIAAYAPEDFEGLFARIRHLDPLLFLVLRHWQDYLPSKYAQDTTRGGWLTLPETLVRLERDFDHHLDANFGMPFRRAFEAGFRSLMAIGYRTDSALDIVAELTGIQACELDGGQWPSARINRRADPLLNERLRLVNAIVGVREGLAADHVYEGWLAPHETPHFLLLTDETRLFCKRQPKLAAQLDAVLRAHEVRDWVGEGAAPWVRWRSRLDETLSQCSVVDRLGAFEPPSDSNCRVSLAGPEHLSAALTEEIFEHIMEIRREVWSDRLKSKPKRKAEDR